MITLLLTTNILISIVVFVVFAFITYMLFETKGSIGVFIFYIIGCIIIGILDSCLTLPFIIINSIKSLITTATEKFAYDQVNSFTGYIIASIIVQFAITLIFAFVDRII